MRPRDRPDGGPGHEPNAPVADVADDGRPQPEAHAPPHHDAAEPRPHAQPHGRLPPVQHARGGRAQDRHAPGHVPGRRDQPHEVVPAHHGRPQQAGPPLQPHGLRRHGDGNRYGYRDGNRYGYRDGVCFWSRLRFWFGRSFGLLRGVGTGIGIATGMGTGMGTGMRSGVGAGYSSRMGWPLV